MRLRPVAFATPMLALSLAAACSDGTGPGDGDLVNLALDFCAGEAPIFFAVINDGGDWNSIPPSAGGTFEFQATEKFGLAMTFSFGSDVFTDVYYAAADEVEPLSGVACTEVVGSKTLNGSVSGVAGSDRVVASMSGDEFAFTVPPSTFQMINIPTGPQDLVAHRDLLGGSGDVPTSVIVRRALNIANNGTIAVLDFNSNEADPVSNNTLSISGINASESNYYDIFFSTASGTTHTLFESPFFTSSSQTLYGIPSVLTQAGDLHHLDLNAVSTDLLSYRSLQHFYRNPDNKSVALGGSLNQPSVTSVATSPYLRMRATLASQFEYGSFATAVFEQGTRTFFVTETSGFNDGTPATWNLEIPDLTSAGNFPVSARLQSGQTTTWFVEAYQGALADLIGVAPAEGSTVKLGGRSSTIATVQMARIRATRAALRSRFASRTFGRGR